jgi:hypothetical protein
VLDWGGVPLGSWVLSRLLVAAGYVESFAIVA